MFWVLLCAAVFGEKCLTMVNTLNKYKQGLLSVCMRYGKAKAVPLEEINFPKFHDNGTRWWYNFQPYAPAAFTPSKYTWYSLLIEAESTPGP
jgi:hypothetical protein